jgi:hypothetical protein
MKAKNNDEFLDCSKILIEYELIRVGSKLTKYLNFLIDSCVFGKHREMLLKFIKEMKTELENANKRLKGKKNGKKEKEAK